MTPRGGADPNPNQRPEFPGISIVVQRVHAPSESDVTVFAGVSSQSRSPRSVFSRRTAASQVRAVRPGRKTHARE